MLRLNCWLLPVGYRPRAQLNEDGRERTGQAGELRVEARRSRGGLSAIASILPDVSRTKAQIRLPIQAALTLPKTQYTAQAHRYTCSSSLDFPSPVCFERQVLPSANFELRHQDLG